MDIKVDRWFNGKHYYAKIGNVVVVDEFGNVKWNTPERAKEVAINYLDKLNSIYV